MKFIAPALIALALPLCLGAAGAPGLETKEQEPMKSVKNIVYNPSAGEAGKGDLILPAKTEGAKLVLLIHGGAWNSMDRSRMGGIAAFLAKQGCAVFNIDYRLLPQAPYPACEDDCLLAAKFLLESDAPELAGLNRSKLIVAGASAGGQLALMTGLKAPKGKVAGIIDISGPSDLTAPEIQGLLKDCGFSRGAKDVEKLLHNASPVECVAGTPPPLLIVHSFNDKLVDTKQADRLYAAWRAANGTVQSYIYNGDGTAHGIWRDGANPPRLKPELETQIEAFLKTL